MRSTLRRRPPLTAHSPARIPSPVHSVSLQTLILFVLPAAHISPDFVGRPAASTHPAMPMPQRRLPPSWPTDGTGLRSPTTSSPGGSLLSSPAGSSNDLQRYVLGLSPLSSLPSFAACCSAAPSCQPSSSADAHASQRAVEAPTHPRQHERSSAAGEGMLVRSQRQCRFAGSPSKSAHGRYRGRISDTPDSTSLALTSCLRLVTTTHRPAPSLASAHVCSNLGRGQGQ